jgi:hypothetical protein
VQRGAHRLDALAHRRQLGLPVAPQRRLGEHGGDDLAAVDRRARVVAAHRELELAEDVDRFAASAQTTLSAPQRSPYRLMLFENELATKNASGRPERSRRAASARSA